MMTPSPQHEPSLVRDLLEMSAHRAPDHVALITDEGRFSYGDIEAAANRLANGLRMLGVQPNDRVMIVLPNSFAAVIAIFAALKASAVFSVVNESVRAPKLRHLLADSQARVLISSRRHVARLFEESLADPVPTVILTDGLERLHAEASLHDLGDVLDANPSTVPPRMATPDDLASLVYTSGSSGNPKGVMCGNDNVVFAAGSIITYLENTAEDIVINGLPFSFDYGLYQLLMTFYFGGTLVLLRSFAFPAEVLQTIERERVTGLPGVPTLFAMLLQLDLAQFDLHSLRYLTNTAAALAPSHIEALRAAFPTTRLYSMYGLTECKRALYLPPEELDERPGSVGIPIPGTEAWIVDDEGNRLGPQEEGELVIRGRHVMRGYWGDPELTAKVYRPDRKTGQRMLYTGDIMRTDAAGRFYFVGRTDDIIKTRGEKVAPKEVENALYQIPGVTKAAVVGEPDAVLGQRIKAYVVCNRSGMTAAEVLRHCKRNLEDFMIPSVVEMRGDLPVSPSGKVSKKGL